MDEETQARKERVETIGTAILAAMVSNPHTSAKDLDDLPRIALRVAEKFVDCVEQSYPEEEDDV